MEIINIETGPGIERRLSEYQGIALTDNISDMECITESETLLLQGVCMVYVESGKASFSIAGQEERVEAGELICINFGQRISDILYSSGMQFRAFFLNLEFLNSLVTRLNIGWNLRSDMMQMTHLKIQLEEKEAKNVLIYYDLLDDKRQQTRHQQQGIDALCDAFGYEMLDLLEKRNLLGPQAQLQKNSDRSAMQQHFDRFMTLLMNDGPIERKVNWYASQLCITPKYLNMICQSIMQQSPSDLIEKELSQRAIQMLRESTLSIKEISQQLGFNNQSHFGTFMRRDTGKSPQQIRCTT